MFQDPEVKAVICACGGYGTGRIAEAIDYDLIRRNPKIFWGYSDITFLHTAIQQQTGLVTFHGPMLSSDVGCEEVHPYTKDTFLQLFTPKAFSYTNHLSPLQTFYHGTASGEITGGNLALIVTTLGTPFEIDTKGKLLLIEDIDEEPYKIDRMMQHLASAGKLHDATGFIIGDFHQCEPKKKEQSLTLDQLWETYIVPATETCTWRLSDRSFISELCHPNRRAGCTRCDGEKTAYFSRCRSERGDQMKIVDVRKYAERVYR